jgi:tRNA threonylcarbamoyladenosine biosynthesis protein TsaE
MRTIHHGDTGHGENPWFISHSADETTALGRQFASQLRPGTLVLLRGDLGAGKTTLIKGIAEGCRAAAARDVTSPTFTLIHEYRSPEITLYHIDLYRVDTQRELDTLAIDDLRDPSTILLIEWGEKFTRFLKEKDAEIVIEHLGGDDRRIRFEIEN